MKRTKPPQLTRQLKLETTTVKLLDTPDFSLVKGGATCAIKTNTCRQ